MKFTLSWLKIYLDTSASADEIAIALTRNGLEVESVENPALALSAFKIAYIKEAVPHPNADKLRVCAVDTGSEIIQVVCGAPNARTGMKAVLGRPGDYVPGLDVTLKETEIRGVKSQGMMCSARELNLGEDQDGILDLSEDAPLGTIYADYIGMNDPVFDVSITPNKQDCMGVLGIARDLAAAGVGTLKPNIPPTHKGEFPQPINIHIEDTQGCPAFLGRVIKGVKNNASPEWMQKLLIAVGQKPISALVDVTNFMSIHAGRPLHVYDAQKLQGDIIVRAGRAGDLFLALNDKEYAPRGEVTCITDSRGVIGVGGIIGGMSTGCDATTTDVLIECAYFNPACIGAAARSLGVTTDARQRFERGVDPDFMNIGLEMATAFILEICGGTASEISLSGVIPNTARTLEYNPSTVEKISGISIDSDRQKSILEKLGFNINAEKLPWIISVPSWRRDIDGAPDIVEEVLRLHGYDAIIGVALPRLNDVAKPTATPMQLRHRRVRHEAAAQGFAECITWAFISPTEAAPFGNGAWTLENPISTDLAVMRPSLIPGLISAAKRNRDRGQKSVQLFECGKRYVAADKGLEKLTLGVLATGEKTARHWSQGKSQAFDVWDAKSHALALLQTCGVSAQKVQFSADASNWFHPGRSGVIKLGPKNILAEFGELHPSVCKALDIVGPVIAVEIYLDAIPITKTSKRARPVYAPNDLQSTTRDFAFVIAAHQEVAPLINAIRGADKYAITQVDIFDVFRKDATATDISVAVTVTLQPKITAFTTEQLEAISTKIIAAAEKAVGAKLRR
jgi:phenylalanyl-tRNA synthetase beta chain